MLVVEARGLRPVIARFALSGELLSTVPFTLAAQYSDAQVAALTITHTSASLLEHIVPKLRQLRVPIIPLHHLETHFSFYRRYPYLALVATSTDTQLILVLGLGDHRLISINLDASLGQAISSLASEFSSTPEETERLALQAKQDRIHIPVPMSSSPAADFSFQGPWMRALQYVYPRS
jgi:tRNA A37 threonylcarbamoyltransferase TsaD